VIRRFNNSYPAQADLHCYTLCSPDMTKSLLGKGALVLGAAVSFLALAWLVGADQRLPHAFGRNLFLLGIIVAAGGFMFLWSTIIGLLSRTRIWSPPWTFLAGALPFYILAIWIYFFSGLQMRLLGYTNMLLMVCFGSASGAQARKKAFPQFSDKDSPSADLPPPTLFPK
jgi:hypothetical protein